MEDYVYVSLNKGYKIVLIVRLIINNIFLEIINRKGKMKRNILKC